ncbi:hypothetical protein NHX12_001585 [Muraenolepis orangiensis]|uniref:C2H2-type domain-containing protein n=1 Tax=Muraenolepis orangiensis TaxID=630683 RepID=A0A9Q0E0Q4_9TELE|nr:hypothetical protein NHX12_001585 [Muraenolepis orangiensis]
MSLEYTIDIQLTELGFPDIVQSSATPVRETPCLSHSRHTSSPTQHHPDTSRCSVDSTADSDGVSGLAGAQTTGLANRKRANEKPHKGANDGREANTTNTRDAEDKTESTDDSESDGTGDYCCSVCALQLPSNVKLQDHMNLHTGHRPHCCAECGKRFCQLKNYRVHLKTHAVAKNKLNHCRICRKGFKSELSLMLHLKSTHFEMEFYECDFCKLVFTDRKECEKHIELHKSQTLLSCVTCGHRFSNQRSLKRHLSRKCRNYICTDCNQSFTMKNALLKHSFSHIGLLPYTCLLCSCHFRLARLYRQHKCEPQRIHCVACLRVFPSQQDFQKHIKDTGCWGLQEPKGDEIRCPECGESFPTKEELKKHGSAHQRILTCDVCGKGFRSALMLMSHMGGHASQTPCLCQSCGRGFLHQQDYDKHLERCGLPRPQVVASSEKPAEGSWKLTLDKLPPRGLNLVLFVPVNSPLAAGLVSTAFQRTPPAAKPPPLAPAILGTHKSIPLPPPVVKPLPPPVVKPLPPPVVKPLPPPVVKPLPPPVVKPLPPPVVKPLPPPVIHEATVELHSCQQSYTAASKAAGLVSTALQRTPPAAKLPTLAPAILGTHKITGCPKTGYVALNRVTNKTKLTPPVPANGQCSWFEMQQFIGDLITSGNTSGQSLKEQHDVLHVSWGLAGGEYLGLKGPAQDKSDLDQHRLMVSGAPERRAEFRDGKEVEHELHACTCSGCPFSTSPPSYETLKPRKAMYSHGHPDKTCLTKNTTSNPAMNLSLCLPDENTTEPSSTTTSDLKPRGPRRDDRERTADCSSSRGLSGSFPHFPMFACLSCHGLQTCAQLLRPQEGPDSGHSHGNTHGHHFHHPHCPFSSCLPCPQLAHSHPHAAQLRSHFPYLGCQHSFGASQKQTGQKQGQPQEEGGRAAMFPPFLHPCMHCSAAFQRPSQLLQHQRSEHAQKPAGFLCTECGKAFNSHSNLRIHQNVHTGARPYVCPDCGKSFSQSGALKIHKRIHTGERPYSCAFCGRGFPHLAGVRAHQRTHTGEKPYRCGLCGKCFTQSGALKIHTRMHTGERPFTCGVCEKGFTNLAAIRFHYRTIHGLTYESAGRSAAGSQYRDPANPGYPSTSAGRPRNSHSTGDLQGKCTLAEGEASVMPRGPAAQGASAKAHAGGHKEGLMYACEDCGQGFKDAPSRNRHQNLVHYTEEGHDVGQTKGLGMKERMQGGSGDGSMH